MPKITATKEVRYGGVTYRAGENFEATDKDAKLLVRIGKASIGTEPNLTDLPQAEPESGEAESEPESVPEAEEAAPLERPRRAYRRRDMRSED